MTRAQSNPQVATQGAESAVYDCLVGTASVVCGTGVTKRHGVRPSVRLSVHLAVPAWVHKSKRAAGGLLLWARRAEDIDRLLHGRRSVAAA